MKKIFSLRNRRGFFGAIDCNGRWVVPPIFDMLTQFDCGYASARFMHSSCIVDFCGNIHHLGRYEEIEPPCDRFAICWTCNKREILNLESNLINCVSYESVENFGHGLFAVEENSRWGIVDSCGEKIMPIIFESYPDYYPLQKVVVSKYNGCYIRMNMQLEVVGKYMFHELGRFCSRGAIARLGPDYGVIDEHGRIRMPLSPRRIIKCCDITSDMWLIESGNAYAIYDINNFSFFYQTCDDMIGCEDGVHFWILENGVWSLYDHNGYCIVHNYCKELGPFVNGYLIASDIKNNEWLVKVDKAGIQEIHPRE